MTIIIENKEFECSANDTILDVARRNGIRIPTICYLSGCSPTLACKMCMVEVNGKRAYSCNAKVKDGMNVLVNTEEILQDRKEIMTTYCVNHPLECGVCDKSGECELQDFTLHTKVDTQLFGLREADKKSYSFAQSFYDPALCIMCERCATTCKDNIGEGNLKAGKANLFTPDNHKDSMGKDPYSVWAKRQKGLIEFIGTNECKDCGECISVCPVGAMTYKDFTYTSNAWELQKIESTCALCPAGCNVIYNVKHLDVKGDADKVYRVQNDYLYNPICGAGRFVFDNVSIGSKDILACVESFKRADSVYLGGNASNEEALLSHIVSKVLDIPLFSYEARLYQCFYGLLDGSRYKSLSIESIATFDDFKEASAFISLHCYFKYDAPLVRYRINNNLKLQKNTQLINISLFKDSLLQGLGKNALDVIGSSGSISMFGILGLLFANDLIDDFIDAFPNALKYLEMEANKLYPIGENTESTQDIDNSTNAEDNTEARKDKKDGKTFSPIESMILQHLNIKDFSGLKLAKKGGILLLSWQSIDDFMHNIAYNDYEIELIYSKDSTPSIQEAVSATIVQDLAKPVASDLIDIEGRVQIFSRLIDFLCEKLALKTFYIPKDSNTVGIANICSLASLEKTRDFTPQYSIGIRTKAHFILDSNLANHADSALSFTPDFPLPSLMQNEGSITNIESRLLPLNPSVPYLTSSLESALDFSDIAIEIIKNNIADANLGDDEKISELERDIAGVQYIGDFTKLLHKYAFFASTQKSYLRYQHIAYENLVSCYHKDGRDLRGYRLSSYNDSLIALENCSNTESSSDTELAGMAKDSKLEITFFLKFTQNLQDSNAIKLESQNHFNHETLNSKNLQSKSGIYTSATHLKALGLNEGDYVNIKNDAGLALSRIYIDHDLDGEIFLMSPMIDDIDRIFGDRFYTRVVVSPCVQESSVIAN